MVLSNIPAFTEVSSEILLMTEAVKSTDSWTIAKGKQKSAKWAPEGQILRMKFLFQMPYCVCSQPIFSAHAIYSLGKFREWNGRENSPNLQLLNALKLEDRKS